MKKPSTLKIDRPKVFRLEGWVMRDGGWVYEVRYVDKNMNPVVNRDEID